MLLSCDALRKHLITCIASFKLHSTNPTTITTTTSVTASFRQRKAEGEGAAVTWFSLKTKKKYIDRTLFLTASGIRRIYAIIQPATTPPCYFRHLRTVLAGLIFSLCPRCLHVFQYSCCGERLRQHGPHDA